MFYRIFLPKNECIIVRITHIYIYLQDVCQDLRGFILKLWYSFSVFVFAVIYFQWDTVSVFCYIFFFFQKRILFVLSFIPKKKNLAFIPCFRLTEIYKLRKTEIVTKILLKKMWVICAWNTICVCVWLNL